MLIDFNCFLIKPVCVYVYGGEHSCSSEDLS